MNPCATLSSLPFIFGLAIPAQRRWSSGRFTQHQNKVRHKIPEKPPAMAVFSFQTQPDNF
jgi:hypothetical protein